MLDVLGKINLTEITAKDIVLFLLLISWNNRERSPCIRNSRNINLSIIMRYSYFALYMGASPNMNPKVHGMFSETSIEHNGINMNGEAVGNYNYGAGAATMGIPLGVAKYAAGIAGLITSGPQSFNPLIAYDSSKDAMFTENGFYGR